MRNFIGQYLARARLATLETVLGTAALARKGRIAAMGAPRRWWRVLALFCSGVLFANLIAYFVPGGESGHESLAGFAAHPFNKALIAYVLGYVLCFGTWNLLSVVRRLGREEMTRASFLRMNGKRTNWPRRILQERK